MLDHLAGRLVKESWSVKKLVRAIVLTRAYRLGSETSPANLAVDPANRLVWRHAPRRLDAEEVRDATLAASGKLDLSRPEASPAKDLKAIEMPNNGPIARGIVDKGRASAHRSLYLPLLRGLAPTSLEVFDFAEQGMVTGHRDRTTVATQALYLLNDPFVRRQALNLAERVLERGDLDDAARVDLAYRLTLGRSPTTEEVWRTRGYLADFESAAGSAAEESPEPSAVAVASAPKEAEVPSGGNAAASPSKPPTPPIDPDQIIQVDAPIREEVIKPKDARTAAWASFCQALLGSAEFRFVK